MELSQVLKVQSLVLIKYVIIYVKVLFSQQNSFKISLSLWSLELQFKIYIMKQINLKNNIEHKRVHHVSVYYMFVPVTVCPGEFHTCKHISRDTRWRRCAAHNSTKAVNTQNSTHARLYTRRVIIKRGYITILIYLSHLYIRRE